jgi:hypothetical protein
MSDLLLLARRLYRRRNSGNVVRYKMVDPRHTERDCHQNAGTWARVNPGNKAVHGWLVFDYESETAGPMPMVQFNPHTIIETEDGERYDVTPSRASRRYPFLDHDGSREDFVRIVEDNSLLVISYNPLTDCLV